jgi:hypothetical protein
LRPRGGLAGGWVLHGDLRDADVQSLHVAQPSFGGRAGGVEQKRFLEKLPGHLPGTLRQGLTPEVGHLRGKGRIISGQSRYGRQQDASHHY